MKVLLINPPRLNPHRMAKKIHPPLNLLYLATALKERGIAVEVLDACAANMDIAAIVAGIGSFQSNLVGFPLFSDILGPTNQLVRATRKAFPALPIVLGGIHVTAVPEQTARMIPEADYFLSGYAEKTLCMLAEAINTGSGLEKVPNLTWRNQDKIITNPDDEEELDVNAITFPDRSLVRKHYENGDYYQLFSTLPFDSIVTGRGCPFRCGFCYNSIRKKLMVRSAENIQQEIYELYKNGARFLDVDDDNFAVDRSRAMKIFSWIQKERLDLQLFLKARPDNVDRELLAEAKKSGVSIISYGIESGSQRILDAMNKRTSVEKNAAVIAMTKAAGIDVHAGFLIGFPGETPEMIEQSIRFVLRTRPTAVSLQILKPYVGTMVYEQALAEGTLVGSWDPDETEIPWVRLPWTRTREDLDRLAHTFNRRIYLRPGYIFSYSMRIIQNANLRMAKYAGESLVNLFRKEG